MTRHLIRRLSLIVLAAAIAVPGSRQQSASEFAKDVHAAWAKKARNAHRKWDRYVLGLDWDDPYHEWHDESYATGPMHR